MKSIRKMINELELQTGMSIEEICEEGTYDSVCWGICGNPECDFTTEVEPDQDQGWCDLCGENTVESALVILGLI